MKKLLLVALFFASPAYGQVLQRSQACQIPGNASKLNCSLSKPTTAGSTIRVIEIDRSGAGARSVAGLTQAATFSGNGGTVTIWRGASNGTVNFTVNLPSAYNPVAWVQEDTFSTLIDGTPVTGTGALNSQPQQISAGTLTTTTANDYLVMGCADNLGAGFLGNGAGWNAFQVATFVPGGFEDRIAATPGKYAANGTLAFAQYQWSCLGIAFGAGNGPPPPPPPSCVGTATVTVNGAVPPPLTIVTPVTLPQGTVGQAYSVNLATAAQVSGGVAPYFFSANTALPPGLIISSAGMITGIPTTAGTTTFTFTVTDSSGTAIVVDMKIVAGK